MMLDTSRHFLSLNVLKKYIDAMMFNKLNVLHIHFTDDPSFPIEIKNQEDLSNFGKFDEDQFYSVDNINELIQYGLERGVRIIPEIDSPTNTYSWGFSDQLKSINVFCKDPASAQLDPSQSLTFSTLQQILSQINSQFPDKYVHFGGQAANATCYQQSSSVSQFMTQNNMNTLQLQQYYRTQQKKIWRQDIDSPKQNIIYWVDKTNLNIGFEDSDILQWIGTQADVSQLKEYNNQIILSYGDVLSLDKGFGTVTGQTQDTFSTWLMVYQGINFQDLTGFKGKIIGAEALLWGELNTDQTTMLKSWIRGSSLAERTWNSKANDNAQNNIDLVYRLQDQLVRMTERGIPCSPITTEYCTDNAEVCFYNH
ncbi:Glycoside hydrolase, superfamily [Pseudocohnilembus persalinus]|uniref:beta-N-acetylhexosaminidase n=1 Tax=Pseudocohnilembus persalinus TaxID=266149 RepID=A0A0V0QM48_PSEPJ|nr:Glycoside hydrolase, superfamily [Pseudocohnilembus persalinus]|eukprot:KRX03330.1 Glycoside hydrolase, superfamily [Pseudocohnilembus persalinus]